MYSKKDYVTGWPGNGNNDALYPYPDENKMLSVVKQNQHANIEVKEIGRCEI